MKYNEFALEFEKWTRYLKGFAFRLTGDKHLAEDLYQDTAVQVFRHREKYKSDTNMKAWSGVIMRNTFINDYRKKKRRGVMYDGSTESYLLNTEQGKVKNDGEKNILIKELFSLIDSLEEGIKIPFIMAYEGFKYEEISQEMNLPLGTVKSRIFQARKALKQQVNILYNSRKAIEPAA